VATVAVMVVAMAAVTEEVTAVDTMVAGTSAVIVSVAFILVAGIMVVRASHPIRSGTAARTSAESGMLRCVPQLSATP
jgi:hypothetical protein